MKRTSRLVRVPKSKRKLKYTVVLTEPELDRVIKNRIREQAPSSEFLSDAPAVHNLDDMSFSTSRQDTDFLIAEGLKPSYTLPAGETDQLSRHVGNLAIRMENISDRLTVAFWGAVVATTFSAVTLTFIFLRTFT